MQREYKTGNSRKSRIISHHENTHTSDLQAVELLAGIRRRILEQLSQKQRLGEMTEAEFVQRIGRRTPSWRTEILTKQTKPWPDSIALLVQTAKVLGVSVAYLVGEERESAQFAAVRPQIEELSDEGLEALLKILPALQKKATHRNAGTTPESPDAGPRNTRRTRR